MIKKEWGKSPAKIPRWGVFKSKIPHIFLSTIYQLFIQMKFLTNEHNQTQPDKKNRAYQGFRGLCRYEQTQPDSTRQAPLSSHNPEVVGSSPAPATIKILKSQDSRIFLCFSIGKIAVSAAALTLTHGKTVSVSMGQDAPSITPSKTFGNRIPHSKRSVSNTGAADFIRIAVFPENRHSCSVFTVFSGSG